MQGVYSLADSVLFSESVCCVTVMASRRILRCCASRLQTSYACAGLYSRHMFALVVWFQLCPSGLHCACDAQ